MKPKPPLPQVPHGAIEFRHPPCPYCVVWIGPHRHWLTKNGSIGLLVTEIPPETTASNQDFGPLGTNAPDSRGDVLEGNDRGQGAVDVAPHDGYVVCACGHRNYVTRGCAWRRCDQCSTVLNPSEAQSQDTRDA